MIFIYFDIWFPIFIILFFLILIIILIRLRRRRLAVARTTCVVTTDRGKFYNKKLIFYKILKFKY